MFYVKERINDAVEVNIEINDENVFCTCPKCFKEVQVDLGELVGDKHFDLFGTSVCCRECSQKLRKEANYDG